MGEEASGTGAVRLLWRVREGAAGSAWCCFRRTGKRRPRYLSLCGKHDLDRVGDNACRRPAHEHRCWACDKREQELRGWSEPGPETPEPNGYRDPATAQYAFDGDFARMCVCGHTLGDHLAGGFDCTPPMTHPVTGEEVPRTTPCPCERFRQTRAKDGGAAARE